MNKIFGRRCLGLMGIFVSDTHLLCCLSGYVQTGVHFRACQSSASILLALPNPVCNDTHGNQVLKSTLDFASFRE